MTNPEVPPPVVIDGMPNNLPKDVAARINQLDEIEGHTA